MTQEKNNKTIKDLKPISKSDLQLWSDNSKIISLVEKAQNGLKHCKSIVPVIYNDNVKSLVSSTVKGISALALNGLKKGGILSASKIKSLVYKSDFKEKEFKYRSYINTYSAYVHADMNSDEQYRKAKIAHDALRAFQKENNKHMNFDPKTYEYRNKYLTFIENPIPKESYIDVGPILNSVLMKADLRWDELNLRRHLNLND